MQAAQKAAVAKVQSDAKAAAEKAKLKEAQNKPAEYPGKEFGFKPIEPPPLPYSAAKQEQLDDLLTKYKADQISSEEYQKQRAAILAAP